MGHRITQAVVDRLGGDRAGEVMMDGDVPGLRIRIGKRGSSYRLHGTINNGRSVPVTLTVGRTDEISLREARDRARELKARMRRGEDPRAPKLSTPTVQEAADAYLDEADLAPRTRDFYRGAISRFAASVRGTPIDKLTSAACANEHNRMTRENGKSAANGSARVLKAIYNDTARRHDLPRNPVSAGVRPHREHRRDWSLDVDQLRDMWSRLDDLDPVLRGLWTTLFLSGLRSQEARTLRWEDVDKDGIATIRNPKGGSHRAFKTPLADHTLRALQDIPRLNEFVFPSLSSSTGHIMQVRRRAGFPYSPHMARHTWTTTAIECGIELPVIQLILNHSAGSNSLTLGYVTRDNLLGPLKESVEIVAERLLDYRTI